MPDTRVAVVTGVEGAARPVLAAALSAAGYTNGTEGGTIAFVGLRGAEDHDGLLAIAAASCPVIAIVDAEDPAAVKAAITAGARGLLDLPLRRSAVALQIGLAIAAAAHQKRLESKVALLEKTLKSRRTIEKATQVLATVRGITQADAYEALRKAAMSRRVTMAETAHDYLASIEAAENAAPELPAGG